MRGLWLAYAAMAACLTGSPASAKDDATYELRPERLPGRVVSVEEEVVFDESEKKKQGAETNGWEERWRKLSATYSETVVVPEPLKIERAYERCTQATGKANRKANQPRRDDPRELAFHERTVVFEVRPSGRLTFDEEEFPLRQRQAADALMPTRMIRALLPTAPVEKGEKWKPDAAAVRFAFFGRERSTKECPVKASGKLTKVFEKRGKQLALCKFTIQIGERVPGQAPVQYKLTAQATIDLFDRVVAAFQFEAAHGSEKTEFTSRGGFSKRKVKLLTVVEGTLRIARKETLVAPGEEAQPAAEDGADGGAEDGADRGAEDGADRGADDGEAEAD